MLLNIELVVLDSVPGWEIWPECSSTIVIIWVNPPEDRVGEFVGVERYCFTRLAPVFVLKTNLDILAGGSRHVLVVWFVWIMKTNLLFARQTVKTNLLFARQNCQDKLASTKTKLSRQTSF